MSTGWVAVEEEIALVTRRLVASDVMRRLEILENDPKVLATLSNTGVVHYLRTGALK